ncbi:MAG: heavy-metal-associated domain-containing protein [Candidatus Pacearchaeota archaeon]|nr:heavy-metal-associated domain-containing protein [Candidatus Pacearchaeota archaeon]
MENELPDCCKKKENDGKVAKGIFYGIIPHIGCILFVIASILGSTVLMQFFKPLLMDKNIFYYMIAISLGFATLSSVLYLRKNKMLSLEGVKKKKKYLMTMYGLTVGINLLFFFFIFPLTANIGVTGEVITGNSLLKISVAIPCSGHASLISGELKSLEGVSSVEFSLPNKFAVNYDSARVSKGEILALEVFKKYPAKVLEE